MIFLSNLLLVSLAVAAISMTLSKSLLLAPVRSKIENKGKFWEQLINCPYCLSHWLAAFFSLCVFPWKPVTLFFTIFAIVALSSLISLGITYFFIMLNILDEESE